MNNGNGHNAFDPNLYQAPFPYFGSKSTVAHLIWQRLGDVPNLVIPFFGSGPELMLRPHWPFDDGMTRTETVNDIDGFVSNFWRAIHSDPEQTAHYADWINSENDLHARHWWLRQQRDDLTRRLEGDPDYYDAKIAGWWVWGICNWIGGGWCDPETTGPWEVVGGQLVKTNGNGQRRQRLHLSAGRGINRQRLHLSAGRGINRQLLHLSAGQGINRKLLALGSNGRGLGKQPDIYAYFAAISQRLRRVRVCCGDWRRVCGPSPTAKLGLTGVILDPPYAVDIRDVGLYANDNKSAGLSDQVRRWAVENGDDPLMRIVLCGYEGEHEMPGDWTVVEWKAKGGFSNLNKDGDNQNCHLERLWFSPHCLKPETVKQMELF